MLLSERLTASNPRSMSARCFNSVHAVAVVAVGAVGAVLAGVCRLVLSVAELLCCWSVAVSLSWGLDESFARLGDAQMRGATNGAQIDGSVSGRLVLQLDLVAVEPRECVRVA